MQSINQPQSALIAGMQQGLNYEQPQGGFVQQGFAEGGLASLPRGGYRSGGIGGGRFKGRSLPGGRQGYAWYDDVIDTITDTGKKILKPIGRRVKKLVPRELAGIMQVAAPFIAPTAPWAAAAMSALGQYKQKGKINPLSVALSTAPGWTNTGIANFARKIPGVGDGRADQMLDWMRSTGMAGNDYQGNNFLRSMMDKVPGGTGVDELLFGEMGGDKRGWLGKTPGESGHGMVNSPKFSLKDTLGSVAKGALTKPHPTKIGETVVDKMAVASILMGAASYAEAKANIYASSGFDLEEDLGITEDDWVATDWSKWAEHDQDYLKGNAMGGIPRTRYAMGSAQFPPQRRAGLKWGSDNGEGLGGEEVEADMRYEGGFMPYGEEPKADDVPARLSKDEFVFTDEAVAGAGDGDVNVGAERLYNVMKNLEQGGKLSQETEGIGAMI